MNLPTIVMPHTPARAAGAHLVCELRWGVALSVGSVASALDDLNNFFAVLTNPVPGSQSVLEDLPELVDLLLHTQAGVSMWSSATEVWSALGPADELTYLGQLNQLTTRVDESLQQHSQAAIVQAQQLGRLMSGAQRHAPSSCEQTGWLRSALRLSEACGHSGALLLRLEQLQEQVVALRRTRAPMHVRRRTMRQGLMAFQELLWQLQGLLEPSTGASAQAVQVVGMECAQDQEHCLVSLRWDPEQLWAPSDVVVQLLAAIAHRSNAFEQRQAHLLPGSDAQLHQLLGEQFANCLATVPGAQLRMGPLVTVGMTLVERLSAICVPDSGA